MTAVAAIAAAALGVWGLVYALRGSLLAGCLAWLVVACCFNRYFFSVELGPVTLTLDRLLLAGLVIAGLLQRFLGRTRPRPFGPEDMLLCALIGWLLLSMLTGAELSGGRNETPPLWRLLAGYAMPAAVYWIARQAVLTRRGVTAALATLAVLGLYLAVTGIFEAAGMWALVFPRHIADPELGLHFGRARGPMLQSISFGLYVSVALLAAWLLARRGGRTAMLAVAAVLPVFLAALFFSYTRTVWLGAGLGLLVVLGLTLHRSWRGFALGSMAAAALLLATFKMDSFLAFEREYSAANTRDSAYLRLGIAYVSWQMFQDRPVRGFGLGRFPEAKLPYLSDRTTSLPLEKLRDLSPHNHYLSLLAETGLVGLGLFLLLLAFWLHTAWRLLRDRRAPGWARNVCVLFIGTLAVVAVQWAGHELSYAPTDHGLLFLLAGMTVNLRRQIAEQPDREAPEPEA